MENDDYSKSILSDINSDAIADAIEKVKNEHFQNITHNIYVVVCTLVIFLSLFFLDRYRFLSSAFVTLSITLLHFKCSILKLIYETINISENKNE